MDKSSVKNDLHKKNKAWFHFISRMTKGELIQLEKILDETNYKCDNELDKLIWVVLDEACMQEGNIDWERGQFGLKIFLKYDAFDITRRNPDGLTPLGYYLSCGRPDLAKVLLEHGSKVKDCEPINRPSVLHTIARNEKRLSMLSNVDYECAKLYLQNGGNPNVFTPARVTPLMMAADEGFWKLAELLIKYKADINAEDKEGKTALQYVLQTDCEIKPRHLECAMDLYKAGARLKRYGVDLWNNFMWESSYYARLDCIKFFLERGAKIDSADFEGESCLHYLIRNFTPSKSDIDIAQYLLSQGARLDQVNKKGATPLMDAATCGNKIFLEFALESGEAKKKTENGATGLHLMAQGMVIYQKHLDCAEILMKHGVNINATTKDGSTALMIAAVHGHQDLVRFLLRKGAQCNILDNRKHSALHCAANACPLEYNHGHIECAKLLIKKGVSLHQMDIDKHTPLFFSCRQGHKALVDLFLESSGKERLSDQLLSQISRTDLKSKEMLACIDRVVKRDSKLPSSNYDCERAVSLACELGMPKLTSWILEHCVHYLDNNKKSPLHHLAKYKELSRSQLECAHIILKQCPHFKDSDTSGQTPISIASKNGNSTLMKLLVQRVPHHVFDEMCSLICENSEKKNKYVEEMLKAGVPPDIESKGANPIAIATQLGNYGMVEMLLKYGSVVGLKSKCKRNKSILMFTIQPPDKEKMEKERHQVQTQMSGQAKCATMLIRAGATIETTDSTTGRSLLMFSILGQNKEVFNVLMLHMSLERHLTASDKGGLQALHYVSKSYQTYGNPDICLDFAKDLVKRGVCVDHVNKEMKPPLSLATEVGFHRFVHLLLLCNANPNGSDDSLNTALHVLSSQSVENDHLKCAEILLLFGANPQLKNKYGQSALSLATKYKRKQLKSVLKKQQMPLRLTILSRQAVCRYIKQPVWESLHQLGMPEVMVLLNISSLRNKKK